MEITTSIGGRCKACKGFSRPVLISREAWPVLLRRFIRLPSVSLFGCHPDWGGHSGGDTPLPIPNREVKPSCADGTARDTGWESRSPPLKFMRRAPVHCTGAFSLVRPPPGFPGRSAGLQGVACRIPGQPAALPRRGHLRAGPRTPAFISGPGAPRPGCAAHRQVVGAQGGAPCPQGAPEAAWPVH